MFYKFQEFLQITWYRVLQMNKNILELKINKSIVLEDIQINLTCTTITNYYKTCYLQIKAFSTNVMYVTNE